MYLSKKENFEKNQQQTDFKLIIKQRLTNLNKKIIKLKKESIKYFKTSKIKKKKKKY